MDKSEKWAYKSLSIKYGMAPTAIRDIVRETKSMAQDFFSDSDNMTFVRVANRPLNKNFSDGHEGLSLEELVDNCVKEK